MGTPCGCLNGENETSLYIAARGRFETRKAFKVLLLKQRLSNGTLIKSLTEMWIPGTSAGQIINSGTKCLVPNWKLNELTRVYNLEKLDNLKREI